MTHVWQAQTRGRWYLVLMRHPFATYSYSLKPGWLLDRYGLEQQAEIVRHYWLLTQGLVVGGATGVEAYRAILPFGNAYSMLWMESGCPRRHPRLSRGAIPARS